jgi:hypothetical protein
MQWTIVMYECINGKSKEFWEFGARIVENGVMDTKIWAFEVWGHKWSFQEVLGAYLEFSECL